MFKIGKLKRLLCDVDIHTHILDTNFATINFIVIKTAVTKTIFQE